jgi:outer membrane protein assembly factor BamB
VRTIIAFLLLAPVVFGQAGPGAVTFERIVNAQKEPQNWLTYWGDYTAVRHRDVKQIHTGNVKDLRVDWIYQTGQRGAFQTVPLVVDGVMYFTAAGGNAYAVDAKTGRELWTYEYPMSKDIKLCCGTVNRGLALLEGRLFMATPDAHVVSLDARTGKMLWDSEMADYKLGYGATLAPLIVKDKVLAGVSGGEFGIRGFVDAFDAKTGKRAWRFYTIPAKNEPGGDTWLADSWKRGGGPTWMTGTYDPALNIVYWGVGNPGPDLYGETRKGDNLYTASLVALDGDTGKLKWHFQFTPHDLHDRDKLAADLRSLAEKAVFIGTSSWKYEGWLNQIYTPGRYLTRGRFSKARFEETCLSEYAQTFPIVGGDFSFYQFPSDTFWQKLFTSAPHLKFALKVPEEITARTFPAHPRYGPRAGLDNPLFLNVGMFEGAFLQPLLLYREQVSVLMFEFGTFSKACYPHPDDFIRDLDAFLAQLPKTFRYAVEIRNENFLVPEYFAMLKNHNVAHIFNAWTRMPPVHRQIEIAESFTADFTVARALLRTGRSFEEGVNKFSPYETVQDPNPETRAALRDLARRALSNSNPTFLLVNNRLEGNAPTTIQAIIDQLYPPPSD